MRLTLALCLALAVPGFAEDVPDRALIVTVEWSDQGGATVEKVEKKDMPIPSQRGFPQLWTRFFELRASDREGDVYFAGPMIDLRGVSTRGEGPPPASATYRLIVPDLPEARHLVIIERTSDDPDTGRTIAVEKDL